MKLRQAGPPRFVVRTTFATFIMVASVLTGVFILVMWNVRSQVRGTVAGRLEGGQRMLSALEQRRAREFQAQVETLAENPTLKAAMGTYRAESSSRRVTSRQKLLLTIGRELDKIAARINPDVLSVSDSSGTVLATAGRRRADWPPRLDLRVQHAGSGEQFVTLGSVVYRVAGASIGFQDAELGMLELATAVDEEYARQLSALSGTSTVIVSARDRLVASTLLPDATRALTPAVLQSLSAVDTLQLAGSTYASRLLFQAGEASVYSLDSIDASTGLAMADAFRGVLLIAVGAFALAGFASVWMARTLARPIDTLSRSVTEMTRSREFDEPVPMTGSSLEVDALTETFNTMMQTVAAAEAETRSAYVGAIRALALALDARDPYTAGHAERVSAISVAIGREMTLDEEDLDVLRLGALLHDIGKIAVSDNVLFKPGKLTDEEFDLIKEHPTIGARMLRSVPFLAAHLPIVELHHERPDGKGYPHGLSGDETPLLARIVHVADAFDAITSARSYRSARGSAEALIELWRYSGTQFDAEVVQALARAMPVLNMESVVSAASLDTSVIPAPRRVGVVARG